MAYKMCRVMGNEQQTLLTNYAHTRPHRQWAQLRLKVRADGVTSSVHKFMDKCSMACTCMLILSNSASLTLEYRCSRGVQKAQPVERRMRCSNHESKAGTLWRTEMF